MLDGATHWFMNNKRFLCAYLPKSSKDFRWLYKLARACQCLTPLAGVDTDLSKAYREQTLNTLNPLYYGIVLDITGTERFHKGEENLASRLIASLAERGIATKIAIAESIGAAWALSRFSKKCCSIIRATPPREALADLPVSSLRLREPVVSTLYELGLNQVAQLLKLPLQSIGSRFGLDTLRRIHQALGSIDEYFRVIPQQAPVSITKHFDIPLTNHASVQQITITLLEQLCSRLSLHGNKARSFSIVFMSEKNSITKEISLNAATHTIRQFSSVIAPLIEKLPQLRGVSKITITARNLEKLLPIQNDFLRSSSLEPVTESAKQVVNSMTIRLGASQVCEAVAHESYIPERSFSFNPIKPNHLEKVEKARGTPLASLAALTLFERPPYLFDSPERLSAIALLPDNPPARIRWRGADYKIITGVGPERIAPEWWKDEAATERDYFKLQDHTGRWLWVFRNQKTFEWWVHGVWG